MTNNAAVKKLIESELREERELIKEYAYLKKLEEFVDGRNERGAVRVLDRIRRYEKRLERAHRHVLYFLEELRLEGLNDDVIDRFERIEADIGYFIADFNHMTEGSEEKLRQMVENEVWEDLERYVIGNLEMDINRWLEIDRALLDLEMDMLLDDIERP